MNRKKRFDLTPLLAAALCALLLAGCGTAAQNAASAQDAQTQGPAAQEAQTENESDRRDVPLDSEEFRALEHEIFEANQLDALLKNHASVVFDLTDAPENDYGWRDYFYITPEACYYESPESAMYEYDRVFYDLYDAGDGVPQLLYGLDLRSDYDLFDEAGYQIVLSDESVWFNSKTEEHVACYMEDGLLYLHDKSSAERSAEWFAEHLPFETYDGEIMHNELVADEATKELVEFNYYLESKDGTMRRVAHHTAAYDQPEPRRVRNVRAAFERYCENTIDVTMVVDPGTEREFSRGFTIPIGSAINYRCDNLNENRVVAFDDAEATQLTHWDGMRSKTIYIFTEPTEEQLARYDALAQAIKDQG